MCATISSLKLVSFSFRLLSHFRPQPLRSDICIDQTAKQLNVQRRRIYDVVNILESVDVVARRKKNCYIWHSTSRLQSALVILTSAASDGNGYVQEDVLDSFRLAGLQSGSMRMQSSVSQIRFLDQHLTSSPLTSNSVSSAVMSDLAEPDKKIGKCAAAALLNKRKEQSLGHLTQVFIQMFLTAQTRIVTLDDAGRWLFGGSILRPGETAEATVKNTKGQ